MSAQLDRLWQARAAIGAHARSTQISLVQMPTSVKVWFNVVIAVIINAWNAGEYALTSRQLRERVLKAFKVTVTDHEWTTAVTTLCLRDIPGATHFLIPGTADDEFILNYPELKRFMTAGAGRDMAPAMEMLYGISVGPLRQPSSGTETKWVEWLQQTFGART